MTSRARADSLEPVVDHSLNVVIRDRMKDFILRERLQPGDKLPTEETLSAQLRVSRTAVREALRSMEALGMVEARQGSGRVVCEFNFKSILDNLSYGLAFQNHSILQITEVRKSLETDAAIAVIERACDDELRQFETLMAGIRRKMRAKLNYAQEDHAFHHALMSLAGNELATQLFEIAWQMKFRAADAKVMMWAPTAREVEIHADIVTALLARDIAAARAAVAGHFADIEARLQARLETGHNGTKRSSSQLTHLARLA